MMAALVLTCKARQIANENLLTQVSTPSVGTPSLTWPPLIEKHGSGGSDCLLESSSLSVTENVT